MCASLWDFLWAFLNSPFIGSFFGAFFAFIFGLIAYDYTKKREKWVGHHNALVKAEQMMNRHLNDISNNSFLLQGAIDTFDKKAFTENVLHPLENPELMLDFQNIELINRYMDYQSMVCKVNDDIEGWNRSATRLFDIAISGRVNKDSIDANREHLKNRSKEMILHLQDLNEMTMLFGGYIRVFMHKDKRVWFAQLKKTSEIRLDEKEIKAEMLKLKRESEATSEKDKERTKKYGH